MNKNRCIIWIMILIIGSVLGLYVNSVCESPTKGLKELPPTKQTVLSTATAKEVKVITPEYPQYNIPLSPELQKYTYKQCNKRGISYSMVLSIMWAESKMDITARNYNSNGSVDYSLFQLNSATVDELASEIGITKFNPNDVHMNIDIGVYYLSIMRDNFSKDFSDEDTFTATCFAFNRGGNATRRLIRREGFSVVAPIRIRRPDSTEFRRASC